MERMDEVSQRQEELVPSNSIEMSLAGFVSLIGPVMVCVNPKDSREALRCVEIKALVDRSNRLVLQVVASDGHRLIMRSVPFDGRSGEFAGIPAGSAFYEPFLLGHAVAKTLLGMAKKSKYAVLKLEIVKKDGSSQKTLRVEVQEPDGTSSVLTSNLTEERFPNYAPLFEKPNAKANRYDGVSRILFDPGMMAGLLKACPGSDVEISLPTDETDPVFLKSEESDGSVWRAIIMPMARPE